MFSKAKKGLLVLTLFLLGPLSVFAIPSAVIPGGENIGIQINSKGVIISGFYKVDNLYPGKNAGLQEGDIIVSINDTNVLNLSQMIETINGNGTNPSLKIEFRRNGKTMNTTLNVILKEGVYVTGLYVKDSVLGIGTLTYIDPGNSTYGALGHEIIESYSGEKLEVRDGKIFKSEVISIEKSTSGKPGEKNAKFYTDVTFGTINSNTSSGIFGNYSSTFPRNDTVEVASKNEIKIGEAYIYSTIHGISVEKYNIEIIAVYGNSNLNKNFMFEITDESLLSQTGGIVQGMSGSPIIQNEKIIGAVTHVVVDNPTKGYGIFITNMLEQAEN